MSNTELPLRYDCPGFNQDGKHSDECFAEKIILDGRIGIHWHNFYEMDFFLDGNATQTINGVKSEIKAGSLTLLSNTDFHEYTAAEGCRPTIVTLRFLVQRLSQETMDCIFQLSGKQYDCNDPEVYEMLSSEFLQLTAEAGFDGVNHSAIMFNRIKTVILLMERMTLNPTFEKAGKTFQFTPEIKYIEQNFRRDITLAEVARVTGFSPTYFSKMFRKKYNRTFKDYLLERRLLWAHRLICFSGLPMANICLESGFCNHSNFSRSFRKRFGISPSDLKNSLQRPIE